MQCLRRASGVLAGTEVKGLPSHLAAGAQISERSRAAVSDIVATAWLRQAAAQCRLANIIRKLPDFCCCRAHFGD
jgi:hypothetical protein